MALDYKTSTDVDHRGQGITTPKRASRPGAGGYILYPPAASAPAAAAAGRKIYIQQLKASVSSSSSSNSTISWECGEGYKPLSSPLHTTQKREKKKKKKNAMPQMHYYPRAQSEFKPKLLAGDNVFLQDIYSSDKIDPEKPISAGFYRLEKGEKLVYTYAYHEMKIILEGEYQISDESGQSVTAKPGDVFYFEKGATITFTTPEYGLAFYTGQRPMGGA
ncbi:RmlC-like cupin domain-containing protein [Sphaerosporella brunnea]|uniref:RmlC-like cupin domain-containing protein n=1 Tax=Sphaerosporella brunnea TaxID=1250544 RepID=A0A5J5EV36_9PEZI|nr:RmlC-like cupin domain-containing protein [Sphaerosporella brunnea]